MGQTGSRSTGQEPCRTSARPEPVHLRPAAHIRSGPLAWLDINGVNVHNAFMPNQLISLRLTEEMLERIDQHVAELTEYTGGVPIKIGRAHV